MAPDLKILTTLALSLALASPGVAGETSVGGHISVELNALQSGEGSYTLTFLVINGHDKPVEKAVYETVLFDTSGQVDRLTLFDFGTLPPSRPRVRQFAVTGTTCEALGQILINGAHACDAPDLPDGACDTGLQVNTRTNVEVTG